MLSEFTPDIIRPKIFETDKIEAFFTLKNSDFLSGTIGGLNLGLNTSEPEEVVLEKRNLLFKAMNILPSKITTLLQVHGNNVKVVSEAGHFEGYDAMVTNKSDIYLAIQVADCAAILLADSEHSVIGAAHAGWRGAVKSVITQTVKEMVKLGAAPGHIRAYLSPCISLINFEVGEEVACQFPDQFVDYSSYAKPHVDLKGYIVHQLTRSGIFEEHMEVDTHCTMEDEDNFFSYRREQDRSGRMMGIIKLNNA